MLSQTTEYALRVIVFLAAAEGKPVITREMAGATKVPEGYLAKVLQTLGRAELVVSQRGLGGGFVLARKPEEITVLEVIDAVDPLKRIKTCPLGIRSHGTQLCPLHKRLDDAIGMVREAFSATTIAELLTTPAGSKPRCEGLRGRVEFAAVMRKRPKSD